MPTVSLYGPRKVGTEALPGVRKSAADTALSLGAGAEQAKARQWGALADLGNTGTRVALSMGAEATRMRQQEHDRADDVALMSAQNQLDQAITGILYDPDNGALRKQGAQSFDTPETSQSTYMERAGEIAKSLSTDKQRLVFQKMAGDRATQLDRTVRTHVAGEITRYEAGELTSLVTNAKNNAVSNATDPTRVGFELQRATDAIKKSGPRLGLGPEEVQQQIEQTQSATLSGVIESLLAQDQTKAAKLYFEDAGELLTGPDKIKIQKALSEGTLRATSQSTADKIQTAGGDLRDWLAKAKEIDDPEVRDAVEQRLEHAGAVREREKREADEGRLRDSYNILDRTPDVRAIPPAVWSQLEGGQRAGLMTYAEHKVKGVPIETDLPTYYSLVNQAGDAPEKFATVNLLNYRGKLDETEFKQLASLQLSIKSGDKSRSGPELASLRTRREVLDDTLTRYGIDPNAKANTSEGKAIATLRNMLDRRVDAAQQPGPDGKRAKVTNEELVQTLDGLLGQSEKVPGSWWNIWPGGKTVKDSTKRLVDSTIDDVPADLRRQIEERLRARNRPTNDQTILDVYLELKVK